MTTLEDLENKYSQIPQEIKNLRRWICYNIEKDNLTGEEKKTPRNAITGGYAKSNDSLTWTTFRVAMLGCIKYGFVGLGFMLGEDTNTHVRYFGIDLDNHEDKVTGEKPMNEDEFFNFTNEFIEGLQSYTEYSHSGEGVHIICKGELPTGARRRNGVAVEMYDKGRFFTMTGKVIKNLPINERTEEVKPLWEKYLNVVDEKYQEKMTGIIINDDNSVVFGGADRIEQTVLTRERTMLDDDELISKIRGSQNGMDFIELFNGDMSRYGNDHSAADMALCKILAFWTGCNKDQMDRLFRRSGLMRDKWDTRRGEETYGGITIDKAIASQIDIYKPAKEKVVVNTPKIQPTQVKSVSNAPIEADIIEIDEFGDPVISVKQIFKSYPLTDTGNAERFYDYFGEHFKFNADNNNFVFWDGRTWIKDEKNFIKKYADKLIDVLKDEMVITERNIRDEMKKEEPDKDEIDKLKDVLKAQGKNMTRVANTAGKTAMLTELEHLHDIPAKNSEFDRYENLLNTQNGVIDLTNGQIMKFNKKYMLSKNTNCNVDFNEPVVWLKFLKDIFARGNDAETQQIIDCLQMALGEALTGRTNKDHLFILYGNGSNGKSTFIKTVNNVFGDYAKTINSSLLIQNNNSGGQSSEFSLSALLGARFVSMSETPAGKQLDDNLVKQMTSGEKINAQYKYGQPFEFEPTFSIWMSTNNKPIIRATDFGIWRRIFFFPFLNTFTDDKKDIDMPKKLAAEFPQILGWIIKGNVKLLNQYKGILPKPKCLEEALADYKNEMDVIVSFIKDRCVDFPQYKISAVELYNEYKEWAKTNNEYLMSETKFKMELPKRGYALIKDANRGRVYVGLKLANDKRGVSFEDMGD